MKISGKITSKSEINTKIKKGCSLVFKVEGFDEDLSVWAFNPDQMKEKMPFDIGDMIEVEYEENGDFNSVKKIKFIEEPKEAIPESLKWTHNDIDIRRMSLDICIMALGRLENPSSKAVTDLIEMAQYIEHYLRSGEKFGDFKEAGK